MVKIFYICNISRQIGVFMSSINLITSLNSNITSIPSQQECLEMLKESVSKEIFNNHLQLLRENGIHLKTLTEVSRDIKSLFLNCYVDHGFHAYFNKSLYTVIRNNLTNVHQTMQYLANLYIYARANTIYG